MHRNLIVTHAIRIDLVFVKVAVMIVTMMSFLLVACTVNYYGYSEQQWRRLSEEEQLKAKTEYEEIVKYRQNEQHEDKIEKRKLQIIDFGSELDKKF